MTRPLTGSFQRDPTAVLAPNPVGLVPLGWERTPGDLSEIVRLGYEGIQVHGGEPAMWAHVLGEQGLRAAEVYLALACDVDGPTGDDEDEVDARIAFATQLGAEQLVMAIDCDPVRDAVTGRVSSDDMLSGRGWERLVALLDTVCTAALSRGLTPSFHPHAGTWVETPDEIDRLLQMTPDLDVCLDTGHLLVGGGDPVATIGSLGGRLRHLHLKDVARRPLHRIQDGDLTGFTRAVYERIFCPLGSGVLDLPGVVTALGEIEYDGWLMIEQDTMWEPPQESSAISRRILEFVCREG